MSTGRDNSLTKQIGEFLVCAELGKRNLIATSFAGNIPTFDVLATDELCRTVPIQVKASKSESWHGDARQWMNISYDEATQSQKNHGPLKIKNPDLIYIYVNIAASDGGKDRFFILTKAQLQAANIDHYTNYMTKKNWKRTKNPQSYMCRVNISDLKQYKDNWKLIEERLKVASPDQSLKSPEE